MDNMATMLRGNKQNSLFLAARPIGWLKKAK